MYTCISCKVIFATADLQREHYKSEWHRYNLKRKVAQLSPVTKDEFDRRAAAAASAIDSDSSTVKDEGNVRQCRLCHKTFFSKNAMIDHLKSKKHLEAMRRGDSSDTNISGGKSKTKNFNHPFPIPIKSSKDPEQVEDEEEEMEDDSDDSDWESCSDEEGEANVEDDTSLPPHYCLFCSHDSDSLEGNVKHMTEKHSFFIPDIEYLADLKGLIVFLGYKVGCGRVCLWCDSKSYSSIAAAQQHMLDKGHCKLKHEGEALLSYGEFYDYSSSYPGDATDEEAMSQPIEADGYELILPSGATIGHRSLAIYYRQNLKPIKTETGGMRSISSKIMQHYKALGWTGTRGEVAVKKAKDLSFMRRLRAKQALRIGMKANKLQPHFRPQVMF